MHYLWELQTFTFYHNFYVNKPFEKKNTVTQSFSFNFVNTLFKNAMKYIHSNNFEIIFIKDDFFVRKILLSCYYFILLRVLHHDKSRKKCILLYSYIINWGWICTWKSSYLHDCFYSSLPIFSPSREILLEVAEARNERQLYVGDWVLFHTPSALSVNSWFSFWSEL